jgi:hypothetical protein
MNPWFISCFVVVLYVHLFNAIAKLHFDADRQLTWLHLWRRMVPNVKIQIEL